MLQTAFRPSCMNRASVFEYHMRFKEGKESVRSKEVRTPGLIVQIKNFMDKDHRVFIETINAVWCQCGNCTHNYSRGTEDMEDLCEVCPKSAQRLSARKTLSWQQGDGRPDQFRSRRSKCSGDLWWKLEVLLWPRDQETEFPVEASWLCQTLEGQTVQIHPRTVDDLCFWQHWHDLHALGSNYIDSQQGILRWAFKGFQEEIPSEEASTLQIGSVAFPPEQYTSQ